MPAYLAPPNAAMTTERVPIATLSALSWTSSRVSNRRCLCRSIFRGSLSSRSQCGLNELLEFQSRVFTITHKALNQLSVAIENERLRNVLIVTQVLLDHVVVGKRQRILNSKIFGKARNLAAIVFTADVQTNHLQSLWRELPLELNQMRRFRPAGVAPGGPKIQ